MAEPPRRKGTDSENLGLLKNNIAVLVREDEGDRTVEPNSRPLGRRVLKMPPGWPDADWGNWCGQSNDRLHRFPQQSNAVCKTSTAAKVIIAKLRKPPPDNHTI